jgi:photosystem II stability/assembly factor-like uncharacterized protein
MKRLFTFLLLLTIGSFTRAQWVQSNGPYGWSVNSVIAIPNETGGTNIIAGTDKGIFLSQDDGKTWNAMNSGLTNLKIDCLMNSGSNIYAGTGGGVFLSTNFGISWTAINNGLNNYTIVPHIVINGSNIFACTTDGLYLSTNNGYNWNLINTGLAQNEIENIAISGSNIFACTYDYGVILSTNNGNNWITVNSGFTTSSIQSLAVSGNNVFAGTTYGEVYLSTNNGTNWTNISNGLPITYGYDGIYAFLVDSSNVYVASPYGVYLTTNNGVNWINQNSGLNSWTHSLALKDSFLYAGGGGVYRSLKSDINWVPLNKAIIISKIEALVINGSNLLAGGLGGICLSTNEGAEWTTVKTGVRNVTCMAASGSYVYAGTDSSGVFFSSDNGVSWKSINNGIPSKNIRSLGIFGSNLYVGIDQDTNLFRNEIYHSTNNGISWNRISYINFPWQANCFLVKDSILYAGNNNGIVYTTNNGGSWTSLTPFAPGYISVESMVFKNDGIYILTGSQSVLKSTDNGKTWTGLLNTSSTSTGWTNIDSVFFVGGNNNVFLSTNNGTTWSGFSDGLENPPYGCGNINTLAASDSFIFAGTTQSGVWRRPLSEIMTSVKEPSMAELPKQFSLFQNYPNPFNPSTTINYSLPKSGNVKLTVYNVIGSKVVTIVNEYKPAGSYSVHFNASSAAGGLASGIYLYRLESGNYIDAKKLILIK